MVKCMLRDVGHAQTGSLPDASLCGLLLADQHLDGGGLACTVRANHSDAAHLRDGQANVHDRWLVLGGVLEGHLVHAENHLTAAFHALHSPWLWEHELHCLVAELEI